MSYAERVLATHSVVAGLPPLFHGTKTEMPVGKTIVAKPSHQRMGPVEGVFEWAREQLGIGVSRLKCVFLTPDPTVAENFGNLIYRMTPAGKYAQGHSSWIHALSDYLGRVGIYKAGQIKRKPKGKELEAIELCVRGYFTDKPVSTSACEVLGLGSASRYNNPSYIHEVLAPKATVVKFEYDDTAPGAGSVRRDLLQHLK